MIFMELTGKRIAVLVDILYQEMEVWYPVFRFREAGAEVVLVGAEAGKTYEGKYGYPAKTSLAYNEARVKDFDGVVIPGGYAPDHIRRYAVANHFVHGMNAHAKTIACICHGAWVLSSAKILHGRRVTCYFAIKDDVVNAGAHWEDAEVVVDGNLVTSRKPEDLPAFCHAAIQVMRGAEVAVK